MRFLSGKEKKQLNDRLPKGYEISKKDEIKEENNILYKDSKKFLIVKREKYLPHLKSLPQEVYKSVYTDKGAIPFIAKGADLMKPGIRKIDGPFEKGDIIAVRDENKEKVYALGITLLSSEEMEQQENGKSLEIYHCIGDEYY